MQISASVGRRRKSIRNWRARQKLGRETVSRAQVSLAQLDVQLGAQDCEWPASWAKKGVKSCTSGRQLWLAVFGPNTVCPKGSLKRWPKRWPKCCKKECILHCFILRNFYSIFHWRRAQVGRWPKWRPPKRKASLLRLFCASFAANCAPSERPINESGQRLAKDREQLICIIGRPHTDTCSSAETESVSLREKSVMIMSGRTINCTPPSVCESWQMQCFEAAEFGSASNN